MAIVSTTREITSATDSTLSTFRKVASYLSPASWLGCKVKISEPFIDITLKNNKTNSLTDQQRIEEAKSTYDELVSKCKSNLDKFSKLLNPSYLIDFSYLDKFALPPQYLGNYGKNIYRISLAIVEAETCLNKLNALPILGNIHNERLDGLKLSIEESKNKFLTIISNMENCTNQTSEFTKKIDPIREKWRNYLVEESNYQISKIDTSSANIEELREINNSLVQKQRKLQTALNEYCTLIPSYDQYNPLHNEMNDINRQAVNLSYYFSRTHENEHLAVKELIKEAYTLIENSTLIEKHGQ